MTKLTRKEALEQGYWQCMNNHDPESVALIEDLTDEDGIEWLSNEANPVYVLSQQSDDEQSIEQDAEWYPITNIQLIP